MPIRYKFLFAFPLFLLLNCRSGDVNRLLPSSITDAAKIGLQAVDEAVRLSNDPRVIRYIAVTTATLLAKEAVKTMVTSRTKKIDRLFGTGQSEETAMLLLSNYCYPLLDELLPAAIDLRLRRLDPAFSGDTAGPDVDSMILSYVTRFKVDEAIEILMGTGFLEREPDTVTGVKSINDATHATALNWMDAGRRYQYRIENGTLEMKCGDNAWERLPLPGGRTPRMIAADNNRCFVLTDESELWWHCVKPDQAKWSIDIMRTAVELMALRPVFGDRLCEEIMPLLVRITDSVAIRAASHKWLGEWRDSIGSHAYWNAKCKALSQVVMNVEPLLLKTGEGKSFTAQDYANWSRNAHREGAWSNLLSWRSGDSTFHRGGNIPADSIVDIAIGHWNSTVVTMYVLALGKIWFIDEEIIQPEWKVIENWNAKWAILANEYHPIENSPYPLDTTCRIDASNSVIAVSRRSNDTSFIYWLRWDYHQKDDFVYWPLDWCEHAWHAVVCPPLPTIDFRISTIGTIDPRRKGTVWSIPAPYFTFHNYLPVRGYQGIFGDIQRDQVDIYPVDLFILDTVGAALRFSADRAKSVTARTVEWRID